MCVRERIYVTVCVFLSTSQVGSGYVCSMARRGTNPPSLLDWLPVLQVSCNPESDWWHLTPAIKTRIEKPYIPYRESGAQIYFWTKVIITRSWIIGTMSFLVTLLYLYIHICLLWLCRSLFTLFGLFCQCFSLFCCLFVMLFFNIPLRSCRWGDRMGSSICSPSSLLALSTHTLSLFSYVYY